MATQERLPGPSATPPARPRPLDSVALLLLVGLMVGPFTLPLDSLSDFGYDSRDAFIFVWDFWWTRTALFELRNPFWTDRLFHPDGVSLAFHSYPLTYSVASVPVQLLRPGPAGLATAYNLVVLASFALSALGAHRLALHVSGCRGAAFVAACVYAFAPFRFLNIPRLHVLSTEMIPFVVLAWLRLLERPSPRRAVALAVWLAIAFYTSLEYALAVCLFCATWLALARLDGRTPMRWKAFRPIAGALAGAGLLFLLISAPLLAAQWRAMRAGSVDVERSLDELRAWSPALASFFAPSRLHPLYGARLASLGEYGTPGVEGMRSETSVALAVWLLALLAVRRFARDESGRFVLLALLFLALTLGPELRLSGHLTTGVPMPYRLAYELLPPLRASRDPTRLFPMALLFLSVLAAFGVRSLLGRGARGRAVAALLGILVLFEGLTPKPRRVSASGLVPPLYGQIAGGPGTAVLDLSSDLEAMLAQTLHGLRVTAGRAAVPRAAAAGRVLDVEHAFRRPRETLALPDQERSRRVAEIRRALLALRVSYVVLPGGDGAQLRLAELVGAERVPAPSFVPPEAFPATRESDWTAGATLLALRR